jgi:hypothetical protein
MKSSIKLNSTISSLLKDKNVLYVVLFLASMNFIGYLLARNFNGILFFLIIGFLTSYFSKNMIIILIVATLATNFFIAAKILGKSGKEGLKNKSDDEGDSKDEKDSKDSKGKKDSKDSKGKKDSKDSKGKKDSKDSKDKKVNVEKFSSFPHDDSNIANDESNNDTIQFDSIKQTGKKPNLDYAATLESAYDNLDKLLGSDAIRSMTEDTQRLAEKQQYLMGNMQKLGPMMNKADGMLKGLNIEKMSSMMDGLQDKMNYLGGASQKKKTEKK